MKVMTQPYLKKELANHLRVVTIPMPGVSSATVLVLIGAGGRYETREKIGLSHFLEHMIFKGTKKRPSAFAISSLVDSVGGENNAFTDKSLTGFYIKVRSDKLSLACDILSDTLQNSLFLPEEIARERGTIIEEINMYEDTPMYKIDDVFYQLLYAGHPLGWSVAGTKETVSRITRADFEDYTRKFYQGKDMVLAVAGKVTPEQAAKLAEEFFAGIVVGEKSGPVAFTAKQNQAKVQIESKKTDQAHLYLGFPAFSFFDPDKTVLNVLSAILGGGMSSRLFIQVRERRGLAYYVSSVTDYFAETGLIAARAGLNTQKIAEAIKVILEEFEKIKTGDVSEEELVKAKEFLKGRTTLSLENSRAVAAWYGEKELLEGKLETPAEVFAKVDAVALEDIVRVAKRVFVPEKRNLAIIGPYKSEDKFLRLIR